MKKTRKFLITILVLFCALFTLFGFSSCAKENKTVLVDGVYYSYMSEGRIKDLASYSNYYSSFEEGYYAAAIDENNKNENITIVDTVNGKDVKGISGFNICKEKWGYYEYAYIDSDRQIKYGWRIGTYYESVDSDEIYETIKTITFSKNIKLFKTLLDLPNLTAINVPEDNPYFQSIDGNLYNKDGTELIQYAIGKAEKSFSVPDSVISISDSAFQDCSNLTSVEMGNGITTIGNSAFYNCNDLTSVIIPDSVTEIGSSAFKGCSNLTIYCEANSKPSNWANNWNSSNYPVLWGVQSIEQNDDYKWILHNDNEITILKYLGSSTEVQIPDTLDGHPVTKIESESFSYNTSLTKIVIPKGVTCVGDSVFYNCTNLTSVSLPNSLKSIGEYAFYNCNNLKSIIIPDTVTSIGKYCFYDCYRLTISCKATCKPSGWNTNWNYSNCPVVWGYTEEN